MSFGTVHKQTNTKPIGKGPEFYKDISLTNPTIFSSVIE